MSVQGNPFNPEGAVKPSSIEVDAYEPNVSAHRFTAIETNQQARWVYDVNGNVTYAGYAPSGLSESSVDNNGNPSGWLLQQFSYVSSMPTQRLIAYGNWTNYATASYM